MKPLVYLSGPITGLDFKGCTDWREYARQQLYDLGIEGLSPMRGKEYLEGAGRILDGLDVFEQAMGKDKAIVTRDHWDTTRADFLLCNLLGAERASIGTVAELAWAFDRHIPVVGVIEKKDNIHEHPFVRQFLGLRVDDLDEAIHLLGAALAPARPRVARRPVIQEQLDKLLYTPKPPSRWRMVPKGAPEDGR